MIERLAYLWPEISLFIATCVVMVLGLSHDLKTRKLSAAVAGLGLLAALVLAFTTTPHGAAVVAEGGQTVLKDLPRYAKIVIAIVGFLLLLLAGGTVDRVDEERIAAGRQRFDPLRSNRAEFYAFFLFSLTGLMLCASAADLVWLFLALELTSLPSYIMVAISNNSAKSKEAAVKYFFLGALGAATFLMGFAFIYGAAGSTKFNAIELVFRSGGISDMALLGIILSIIGLAFKIAAVPMHFYTADVYEGAAPQVSGFLAFVPKTAGFIGLMLILATVGWYHGPSHHSLPEAVRVTLWVMAALTMTVGNVLALWQSSVKRVLAYSSIAHSGYMLVGLIAGPGSGQSMATNGLAAILFYLLVYGVTNVGTFAVLACLERRNAAGEPVEIDSFADLRGLCQSRPVLGWIMVLCSLSLLGFPPLLGFFGKVPLFTSAIASGEITLVVILGLNSAIAAFYYLRFTQACLLENADPAVRPIETAPFAGRHIAGVLSAIGVIVLVAFGSILLQAAASAGNPGKIQVHPAAATIEAADKPHGH